MIEGMTAPATSSATSLETLLAQAHAQSGEPQMRLTDLLSALEDADWTLLLANHEALAAQLAALLGPGLIRLDPRLSLDREAFASHGLALASSDGDWKGARAVWLLEPDERALTRARRADVPLIADATLAPGGRWLAQGAQLVVYRDAVTLTGYGDVQMSTVSGLGSRPKRVAAGPADLAVALALRDVGTLALRMNRRTRNTEALLPRFEGRALSVSGGVLLLEHDGPQTVTPLGGNLSAARAVQAGTLVTVGIESPDDAWAVLGAVLMGEAGAGAAQTQGDQPELAQQASRFEPVPERSQARQTEPSAAQPTPAEPVRTQPVQPVPVEVRPVEVRPVETVATAPEAPAEDFSDREFVFSPAPVLPDLPSLPSVPSLVSFPDDSPHDDGRPAPKRNRGRRGKGVEAQPVQPEPVQPEIVMSESFSRPPEHVEARAADPQPTDLQPSDAQPSDAQPADQWPEEIHSASELLHGSESLDTDAPVAESLPLQLPPDLPVQASAAATDGLSDVQLAVYARLREWRNAEAKRQGVSSFIIASNATLAEVARQVPYTEADLKAVKGMGPERLRKYGEKILEVVRG